MFSKELVPAIIVAESPDQQGKLARQGPGRDAKGLRTRSAGD